MKRLLVCLLLVGVVGCGESEPATEVAPAKDLPGSSLSNSQAPSSTSAEPDDPSVQADNQNNSPRQLQSPYLASLAKRGAVVGRNKDGHVVSINLSTSPLSDDDLKGISTFNNLEELYLECTNITDQSVQYLKELANLKVLFVDTTGITANGVLELRRALPGCEISEASGSASKRALAELQLVQIHKALFHFRVDMEMYPGSGQGLDALLTRPDRDHRGRWAGPYAQKEILLDPWKQFYQYDLEMNPHGQMVFRVWSFGPSRQSNGTSDEGGDNIEIPSSTVWGLRLAHKKSVAELQLRSLAQACERYRDSVGQYPSTEYGLSVLWRQPTDWETAARWGGPYLRGEIPNDPWGTPYRYEKVDASEQESEFLLQSSGQDTLPGTEDDIRQLPIPGYLSQLNLAMEQRDGDRLYVLGANAMYFNLYQYKTVRRELTVLARAFDLYRILENHYPVGFHRLDYISDEKLAKKWNANSPSGPRDPWGNAYRLRYSGYDEETRFSITSDGPSGQSNGTSNQGGDDIEIEGSLKYLLELVVAIEADDSRKLESLDVNPEYVRLSKELKAMGNDARNPKSNIQWEIPQKPTVAPAPKKESVPVGADGEIDPRYLKYALGKIRQYDLNKDGVLTKEEWSKLSYFKDEMDADKDGKLTPGEYARALMRR